MSSVFPATSGVTGIARSWFLRFTVPFVAALLLAVAPAPAQPTLQLDVVTWNVESAGSDFQTVSRRLASVAADTEIVALQEVAEEDAPRYRAVLGTGWESILGSNRGELHQLLLFDGRSLQLVGYWELGTYDGVVIIPDPSRSSRRAPLVAEFVAEADGSRFRVVAVHLTRGNTDQRMLEAYLLRRFMEESPVPVIALGDFNFDLAFDPETGEPAQGNASWAAFTAGTAIRWLQPERLVDTQWSDAGGRDRYPNSILDFVFASDRHWEGSAEILVVPGDFPDTPQTSDHRPVRARLVPSAGFQPAQYP